MTLWKFSAEELPEQERSAAWSDMLRRLKLPVADINMINNKGGAVTMITTPLGFEFALMEGSAHTYSGRTIDQDAAIWIAALYEGRGLLQFGDEITTIGKNTIVFGASGVDSTLKLSTNFRMMFVRIPQVAVNSRMIAPLGERVGTLKGNSGIERLLYGFITDLSDNLERIPEDQFQPIEHSIIELFVSCLAADGHVESKGGAAGARALHLKRICQNIETMLHDPELTLSKVAKSNGVSPRYIQKLFAESHMTFSNYVKDRRLKRSYADLISPIHSQLSISEICFRWGFNDAAHFSRAFRQQFGVPPSVHRNIGNHNSPTN